MFRASRRVQGLLKDSRSRRLGPARGGRLRRGRRVRMARVALAGRRGLMGVLPRVMGAKRAMKRVMVANRARVVASRAVVANQLRGVVVKQMPARRTVVRRPPTVMVGRGICRR